jgi:exodeoxyribonuclease VII small subunit
LTIVTQSVDAYKVCQERIDAVEKALGKAFGDTAIKVGTSSGFKETMRPVKFSAPADFEAPEPDDIPF